MAKMTLRIWILIISLFLALLMISPTFKNGVVIKNIDKDSNAFQSGLGQGMLIKEINSIKINSLEDYSLVTSEFYKDNKEKRISIITDKDSFIFLDYNLSSIVVGNLPKSNIKTGLDLSGGARALVRPVNGTLSDDQMSDLVDLTNQRLNVFGLTDLTVKSSKDLSGNNFLLVEVAGASPQDLEELVSKQGNFQAKIGNNTVFIGGEKDITHVFRDASQSAVYTAESLGDGTYLSRFTFTITLSAQAAQRHADITNVIPLDPTSGGQYLSENLTLLLTGSIPYQLEIVKLDTISPSLGKQFTKSLITLGLTVFLIISIILFIKYRKIKITLAVILTMFS